MKNRIAKEEKKGHRLLELSQIPVSGRTDIVGDDFMVADNLDSSEPLTEFIFEPGSVVRFCTPFKIRFSMVLLCCGGRMRLRLGMKEYVLGRGDMLTAVSGMMGECLDISPDAKLAMIAFSDSFIGSEATSEIAAKFRDSLIRTPLCKFSGNDFEDVERIYVVLRRKLSEQGFKMKRQIVYASLALIYCCAFGNLPESDMLLRKALNRKEQIFEDFLRLVETHCCNRHDVAFYADKLCLTPKYLSTTVLEVSGKYASEWIREHLVFQAKALLNSRRYTVQQISEQLGFANQSHFGVYFKRVAGCSPKGYMSVGMQQHGLDSGC
jgi:AraC-like DNA-binding protein